MAIHGVISTYFGDLEYDIGKSLNWTKYFCDTSYVMDANNDDASRRYVVDWDKTYPDVKYSFHSGASFFGSSANAAAWRKESFTRAKAAWNYASSDWVLFIDGTEALNVYHAPPIEVGLLSVAIASGELTFTTDGAHGISSGNIIVVDGASVTGTPLVGDGADVSYLLDGRYVVTAVAGDTFTVSSSTPLPSIADTALDAAGLGYYTTEPPGYFDGSMFQSWIQSEIASAVAAGKDLISLDGWAMVRSSPVEEISLRIVDTGYANTSKIFGVEYENDDPTKPLVKAPRCDEFYVPMGNLVRLAKVSALSNPSFNWQLLDQPQTYSGAAQAELLSLISYAYLRWAERPTDMTQAVDSNAPNYVVGDATDPPLRPVSVDVDAGFAMRRLISEVRPLTGLPLVWEDQDADGQQPLVGDYQKLDTFMYPVYDNGIFQGYLKYGGTPLYPGVVRKNLREGVWYAPTGNRAIRLQVSAVRFLSGVATFTTSEPHYLSPGTVVTVYGSSGFFSSGDDAYGVFDGEFTVSSVTSNTISCIRNTIDTGITVPTTSVNNVFLITMTANMGSVPWNYLLNTFSVPDPFVWIRAGSRSKV